MTNGTFHSLAAGAINWLNSKSHHALQEDIFSVSIDLIARRNNRAPVAQFVMQEIVSLTLAGPATLRVLK